MNSIIHAEEKGGTKSICSWLWKETEADTFYSQSKGLSFFGMTKDDFVRATASAKEWFSGLTNVWSDGQKETDEIVDSWTESFKSLTASTRDSLQEMKDTADAAGIGTGMAGYDFTTDVTSMVTALQTAMSATLPGTLKNVGVNAMADLKEGSRGLRMA